MLASFGLAPPAESALALKPAQARKTDFFNAGLSMIFAIWRPEMKNSDNFELVDVKKKLFDQ